MFPLHICTGVLHCFPFSRTPCMYINRPPSHIAMERRALLKDALERDALVKGAVYMDAAESVTMEWAAMEGV